MISKMDTGKYLASIQACAYTLHWGSAALHKLPARQDTGVPLACARMAPGATWLRMGGHRMSVTLQ